MWTAMTLEAAAKRTGHLPRGSCHRCAPFTLDRSGLRCERSHFVDEDQHHQDLDRGWERSHRCGRDCQNVSGRSRDGCRRPTCDRPTNWPQATNRRGRGLVDEAARRPVTRPVTTISGILRAEVTAAARSPIPPKTGTQILLLEAAPFGPGRVTATTCLLSGCRNCFGRAP